MDSAAPFVGTVLKRMRCEGLVALLAAEQEPQQQDLDHQQLSQEQLQRLREQAERMLRGFAREVFFGSSTASCYRRDRCWECSCSSCCRRCLAAAADTAAAVAAKEVERLFKNCFAATLPLLQASGFVSFPTFPALSKFSPPTPFRLSAALRLPPEKRT